MSPLRQSLADYLTVRRALGYKLERAELFLGQFITYLEKLGEKRVTIKSALAWATLPEDADPYWHSKRLSIVRVFSRHLRTIDPTTEVPPADLLPSRRCRITPYLYSDEDINSLITAATTLHTPHRGATYATLIGVLATTGMRVGEVIGLDRSDFDVGNGLLIVRKGKFDKSRQLPLDPSAQDALRVYRSRRDRPHSAKNTPALLVSTAGTRLIYANVQNTFHRLVQRVGLQSRSGASRPRLHDLRHSFAVRTIIDTYRSGADIDARLALLSTYLGHVNPASTYWYISAAPELLELAGDRLQRYLGGEL
jgi:integrase